MNISFEGGGVCGVAYVGVIESLRDYKFKRFAGSSVGSILATLMCMGATPEFIKTKMFSLNFGSLCDHTVLDVIEFFDNKGLSPGKVLVKYIEECFTELGFDPKITFGELHKHTKKKLYITGTKLSKRSGKTVYFSYKNYPNLQIRRAIRISCSYPLVFRAVKFENTVWIDGGALDNLPLKPFLNHKKSTIAVSVTRDIELEDEACVSFADYSRALISAFLDKPSEPAFDCKLIDVNVGNISSMSFSITDKQKQELYEAGLAAADRWRQYSN